MKTPRIRTILRVVRRGLASCFTASIRSMSRRSISLTSRVTSHALRSGPFLKMALHVLIQIDGQIELGVLAEELSTFPFGEVIFLFHMPASY